MGNLPNWDPAKHPHGEHGHWASVASGDTSAKKAAVAKGAGRKPASIVGKKVKVQLRGGAIHPGVVDREYDTFHEVSVKGHGTIQVPKNPGALDHQIIPSRVKPTGIPAASKSPKDMNVNDLRNEIIDINRLGGDPGRKAELKAELVRKNAEANPDRVPAAKPIDPAVFKELPGLPRTRAHEHQERWDAAGGEAGRIRTPGYRRPSTIIAERIALLQEDIKKHGDASKRGGGEKAAKLKYLRTQLRQAKSDGK